MENALTSLSEQDRRLLVSCAKRQVHGRNDTLVEEGSCQRCIFLIQEGAVRAERAYLGRGVAVARLGPGDTFGEVSLLDPTPASATFIADEDRVEVDVIEGASLDRLLRANPALSTRLYQSLAATLAQRLRDLAALLPLIIPDHIPQWERSRAPRVSAANPQQLPPPVVTVVEAFKADLVRTELAIRNHQMDDGQAQETVSRAVDSLAVVLHEHAAGETPYDRHIGAYVFREAFPFLMRSSCIDRWFTKPRGYAGDFLSIERMYENEAQGDGRLGRFIDRWALDTAPCRATRNRRRLLAGAVRNVALENAQSGQVLVTSLASGPAREIFDLFAASDSPNVRVTCIDIDPEALAYASGIAQREGFADRVTFAQDNVIHLSQGRGKTTLAPQHMIYSVGLIDYLEDKYVIALLDWIHDQLLPGGLVVLGNFDVNPGRGFMDHILEWRLIYRSADDLRDLFARSKFGDLPVDVRAEREGINLFAFCTTESTTSQPVHQTGAFAVFTG